jgi:formamidopyrimidine-DNA glycosylase
MPELPEAETIVRTLAPYVKGQRIEEALFFTRRVLAGTMPELAGRTVGSLRRYGKHILFELDEGMLLVDLRMTGRLLWKAEAGPYTRARLGFPNGWILFDDIRQFGSFRWLPDRPDRLGPDPLEISPGDFARRLGAHRAQVKRLLLYQRFLRGIGNIYADEILYRARIHPQAPASRLSRARALRLHQAMQEVLRESIASGGSSIANYVDANGRAGGFQRFHQVYGKQGASCPRCGAEIRRVVVAQRGTHFCPRCQRA